MASPAVTSTLNHSEFATQLHRFVEICQITAGSIELGAADLAWTNTLVKSLPRPTTVAERLVLQTVIGGFVSRLRPGHALRLSPAVEDWHQFAQAFAADVRTCSADRVLPPPTKDRRVAHVCKRLLEQHSDPTIDADALGREVNLSGPHLRRLMLKETGADFRTNLRRIRVARSRKLLRDTYLSVKQVASAVGYQSVGKLDREFKRETGLTPVEFRRQS